MIYTHEYPPFKGGAGVLIGALAEGVADRGVSVSVVAPRYSDSESEDSGHVQIRRFEPWQLRGRIGQRQLVCACLKTNPDWLIIPEYQAALTAEGVVDLLPPYVALLHGTEVWRFCDEQKSGIGAAMRSRMAAYLRGAAKVVCVSQATRQLLLSYMPELEERTVVILPGIVLNRLGSPTEAGGLRWRESLELGTRSIVLCVGRLDSDKGQDSLLRAMAWVRRDDVAIVFVGDGPDRPKLEALAAELGLTGCVRFTGRVSDADRAELLGACDVFVLPSRSIARWEGFGIVYLEAGYFGKPVIGCKTGGVGEAILEGVTGFVVECDSVDALGRRILELLIDGGLRERIGQASRRRVIDQFDVSRMSSEFVELFAALSDGHVGENASRSKRRRLKSSVFLAREAYRSLLSRLWRSVCLK